MLAFDNLLTGRMDNVADLLGQPRFAFEHYDVTNHLYVAGPLDAILHFASPASPADFERLPIQILKVGSLGTHKALGLAKAKGARFLLASTSECYGDPQVSPQPETLLGPREPGRRARRVRRGQALRRGHDDGLPPRPRARRAHRAHLQHVRPEHADRRRPHDPELLPPGPARRAPRRVRRRPADALDHVRRRPGRGHLAAAALLLRRAGERRQPGRGVGARARAARSCGSRQREPDRVRSAPARRPEGAPARRRPREARARLAAARFRSTRACERTREWFARALAGAQGGAR